MPNDLNERLTQMYISLTLAVWEQSEKVTALADFGNDPDAGVDIYEWSEAFILAREALHNHIAR